jgi:hypothetical protein
LDAWSSCYPNVDRVDRVVRMAVGIGHSLGGATPLLMRHPTLSAVVRAYVRQRRLGVGELGVPEDPVLVAAILRLAWDISASGQVQYLAMCALGYGFPLPEREPRYFHGVAPTVLHTFMPVGGETLDEVITAGVWVRELMQIHGLRSVHVPCEVRFASDARVIDTIQYRWRLYVCLQLRHWLRCLELTTRSDRHSSEYAEEVYRTLIGPDPLVQRSVYDIDATTSATFLSQILCLAEDLAKGVAALPGHSVPQISLPALHRLVPAAATAAPATRAAQVARYWMWWDDAVGRDAYSYLPSCPPSELAAFDQSLGDDRDLVPSDGSPSGVGPGWPRAWTSRGSSHGSAPARPSDSSALDGSAPWRISTSSLFTTRTFAERTGLGPVASRLQWMRPCGETFAAAATT